MPTLTKTDQDIVLKAAADIKAEMTTWEEALEVARLFDGVSFVHKALTNPTRASVAALGVALADKRMANWSIQTTGGAFILTLAVHVREQMPDALRAELEAEKSALEAKAHEAKTAYYAHRFGGLDGSDPDYDDPLVLAELTAKEREGADLYAPLQSAENRLREINDLLRFYVDDERYARIKSAREAEREAELKRHRADGRIDSMTAAQRDAYNTAVRACDAAREATREAEREFGPKTLIGEALYQLGVVNAPESARALYEGTAEDVARRNEFFAYGSEVLMRGR